MVRRPPVDDGRALGNFVRASLGARLLPTTGRTSRLECAPAPWGLRSWSESARPRAYGLRSPRSHGLIRVLFNNAGIYHPGKDWLDVPPDQFDDTMSVNVRLPYFASQWVAKRLIAPGERCDRQHRLARWPAR